QRVQKPHVPVLKAMKPVTRLVRAHAEQAEGVNVFVHIIDVGEGVVVAVVLLRPVKAVAADQVETEGGQPVQAASAAERFVRAIVHHVKTKQGGGNAMGQPAEQVQRFGHQQQGGITGAIQADNHQGFTEQTGIAAAGLLVGTEM